ncbi:MAG: hypothetical protein LQ338_007897, partial [Usnochroma carphineum]
MTSVMSGSAVGLVVDHMRSCGEVRDLPEDSRQSLLQAAKELQHNLETPKETCNRYRYSALDVTVAYIFHQIKLFDTLVIYADSRISTNGLAKETHTDPVLLGMKSQGLLGHTAKPLTGRLLRYAASIGLVKQCGEDAWTASRLTHSMVAPSSEANLEQAFVDALPFFVDLPRFLAQTNFQNPTDSSRTVHQLTRNTCLDAFDWMKENPKHYEILNRFMAANRMIRTGIDAFPFEDKVPYLARKGDQQSKLDSTTPLFVDIGGGRGQMSRVFRSKFPHSPGRIILQDLPQTLANAVPSDCIEAMAHDFFGPQPIKGAKVYFTRHVLHDWPDSKAEVILKRVVEAMDKESVLLIDEKVLPDVGASNSAAGLDLLMMTIFAAQERSEKDWRALLGRAGLRI